MGNELKNEWSIAEKVLFRFVFAYVFVYCFAFPIYFFPFGGNVIHPIGNQLQNFALWIGKNLFGILGEISTDETGSGDALIYWLLWISKLIIALTVTLIWSVFDWKRKSYSFLGRLLITYTRYFVGMIIFSYGLAKAIPTQFIEPSYTQLMRTYGESSPMNLLWTFMGYSTPYQIFGGIMEILAAVLLLFRRTVLLGALIMITVMTNVVAINFAFDVPVKLASSHYLLFSIGLALIFRKNILDMFILQKPSQPVVLKPLFQNKIAFIVSQVFKVLILGYFLYSTYSNSSGYQKIMAEQSSVSPIAGIYQVKTLLDSLADSRGSNSKTAKIKRIIFDNLSPERVTITFEDESKLRYLAEFDKEAQKVKAVLPADNTNRFEFSYKYDEMGILFLKGTLNEDSLSLQLNRLETDSLLLVKRKFQWVSPVPFNR